MTNIIPETQIPDETVNPNYTTEHYPQQELLPPQIDPQFFETLSLPNHNSPNPNQDHDSTMQDLIPITLTIVVDDDLEPDATTDCSGGTTTQHTMKQEKKGPKRIAMERKSREKLQVIVTTVISQNESERK